MAISFYFLSSSWLILFVSIFLLPMSESIDFKITLSDTNNTIFSGDAYRNRGAIELNRMDYNMRVGHVTYANPIQIWDRISRNLTDFTTRFTFIVDTFNQSNFGDALSFFIAPVGFEIPLNSAGQFIGLFNTTNNDSPQNQMLVVEFDTAVNPQNDPPFPHLGININSINSTNYTRWYPSLHSGDSGHATVSYNATTQMLMVSLRYGVENMTTNITTLSHRVDLRDIVSEWVTVGFSGSTGGSIERNAILNWEFSSSLKTVQEDEDNTHKTKLLTVGLAVPFCVLVVAAGCATFWWRRRKNARELEDMGHALTSINDVLERGTGPKRFPLRDLALATDNFSDYQKLGEGGFGCVYKGYLSREAAMIAVKRVSQGSKQGKKEYITEVKIISRLRHRNLVQLIGWCHDETQFLLVYEYMPNGSLDYHLFNQKSVLKWDVRYNIATGLAFALLYLHEECEQCVVHRDIKTSNIMLDSAFNAKLGDFGLARLMDHEVAQKTTGLAGTLGYMAPEYATSGKASKESDVYSFGVVALEIACGIKATDQVDPGSDYGLVEWVWRFLGKDDDELLSCVDPTLKKEYNAKEVERLLMVGLWCSHPDRTLRPSIREVIQVLKFEGALPNLPTKMPVPIYYTTPTTFEGGPCSATMTNDSMELAR